jgi:hypothetical protein
MWKVMHAYYTDVFHLFVSPSYALQKAYNALKASQNPIYIQAGGENKGLPVGIPKTVDQKVVMLLTKVMLGEEEIEVPTIPAARQQARDQDVTVNQERFFKLRKYRDSAFALLASMYSQTRDDATFLSKSDIQRVARNYTDSAMDYDYRLQKWGGKCRC